MVQTRDVLAARPIRSTTIVDYVSITNCIT